MVSEIPSDVIRTVLETYDLEVGLGGEREASSRSALRAGMAQWENRVVEGVAREAEMYAAELERERTSVEFTAALRWFADKVRRRLPPTEKGNYTPANDDIIEISLTGPVVVMDAPTCASCGHQDEPPAWAVCDEATGQEIFFEPGDENHLNIRVFHREGQVDS